MWVVIGVAAVLLAGWLAVVAEETLEIEVDRLFETCGGV